MLNRFFVERVPLFFISLPLMLLLNGCSLTPVPAKPDPLIAYRHLEPNPTLTPDEVIKIQMVALQYNNSSDEGIAITFRFASPDNKRFTGPLPKFTQMIKNPLYKPMLNHKNARYGSIEIFDSHARQRITVIDADGNATTYVFTLSRQSGPMCDGCWMTDGVSIEPASSAGQREA